MKKYSNKADSIRKHTARILSILMILSLLTGGIFLTDAGGDNFYSYAASQTQGDFEFTVSGGSATLTAYNGKAAAPSIPSSIGGYKVTAIGPECFRGNVKITTIKVPEGVTSIGDYAFEACSAATTLVLPSTLKTIGKSAFSGDAQLEKIDIPKNVSKIGDGAFLYCMKVESITGGEGLTQLGQFVFAGCEWLSRIDLSKSKLTALPDRTFCNCTRLFDIKLPDTLETVGKRAFSRCDALGKLEFGPNVTAVGDYAFEKCNTLTDVSFESSTGLELGDNEFHATDGVSPVHLRLPDNTVISDTTLSGARIGGVHVSGSGKLTISGKECLIENGQIYGEGGSVLLNALPERYDIGADKWVAVGETVSDGSATYIRYTVDSDVRRIADGAFENDTYDLVVLPAGIETIDDKAFYGAEIKALSINGDNSKYIIEDGILYEKTEAAETGNGAANNNALSSSSNNAAGNDAVANDTDTAGDADNAAAATGENNEAANADASGDTGSEAATTETGDAASATSNEADGAAANDTGAAGDADNAAAATGDNNEAANADASGDTGSEAAGTDVGNDAAGAATNDTDTAGGASTTETGDALGAASNEAGSADNATAGNAAGAGAPLLAAAGGSADKYRLLRFFKYKLQDGSFVRTTEKKMDRPGPDHQFNMPDNVVSIAPYAFSNAGVHVRIEDTSSISTFEDHSFTNSGISDPNESESYDYFGTLIISKEMLGKISISESAFKDYYTYYPEDDGEEDDSESQTIDDLIRDDTADRDFNDRFARIRDDVSEDNPEYYAMPDGDYNSGEPDAVVKFTSEAGSKSLYSDSKYGGYKVIPNSEFPAWSEKYIDHNKDVAEFSQDTMPYTMLYKGEAHYRSMVCVLNHDKYKYDFSVKNVGEDFAPMYLAMDHGLEAEIRRGGVPDDIVLYSGITTERMADIAGITDKTVTPTKTQLINAIGREFTDPAFMSTTTNPQIATSFSSHSKTMIVIYASSEALSKLGAVVIDSFSGWGAGEYEILFNLGAKFKVLDVGTLHVSDSGYDASEERTYIRLELMAPEDEQKDEPKDDPADEEKTEPKDEPKADPAPDNSAEITPAVVQETVPVIHTTARTARRMMRVYWKGISGASAYRVQYRKAGASKWKTVKVSKTYKTLRKMKNGGLYQYRVATVDSNNKTGTYSDPSYRFFRKTKGIKYQAKKAAVKVKWKKTKGANGYKILYSTNKDLTDASVITIKGGKTKSAVVKDLESGTKYYFSVRPYKDKGGIRYIGIRSRIKRVRVK